MAITDSGTNTEKHDKIVIAGIVIVIKKTTTTKNKTLNPINSQCLDRYTNISHNTP